MATIASADAATPPRAHAPAPSGDEASHAASDASPAPATRTIASRQPLLGATTISQEGEPRIGGSAGGRHMRLKTSVPLVPPKPKLFFTACSIFISRAVLAQ